MQRSLMFLFFAACWICGGRIAMGSTLADGVEGMEGHTEYEMGAQPDKLQSLWDVSSQNDLTHNIAISESGVAEIESKDLNRQTFSRPCCVSWGPGRVDCFTPNLTSEVTHVAITQNGDQREYSQWEELPVALSVGEMECVSRDVEVIDIFAVSQAGKLKVNSYSSGRWVGWKALGTNVVEPPSCVARDRNRADCMSRGISNEGRHFARVDGYWKSMKMAGQSLQSPIGCVSKTPLNVDCFAGGNSRLLSQFWFSYESRSANWRVISKRRVNGRPSVVYQGSEHIDIFLLNGKNEIVWLATAKGKQLFSHAIGVPFESPPECLSDGHGRIYCFAIGERSNLFMTMIEGGQWREWTNLGGRFLDPPSCVLSNDKEISCYLRAATKSIFEIIVTLS